MRIAVSILFLVVTCFIVFNLAMMYGESTPKGPSGWFKNPCKNAVNTGQTFIMVILSVICMALSHLSLDRPYFSIARYLWGVVYLALGLLLALAQLEAFADSGCSDDISFIAKLLVAAITLLCLAVGAIWFESKVSAIIYFLLAIGLIYILVDTFSSASARLSFSGYFFETLYVGVLLVAGLLGTLSVSLREEVLALAELPESSSSGRS